MEISPTRLAEVLVIQPKVFEDARGFFMETYQQERYQEAGIAARFVQDNHSGSRQGVLRGLHYQVHQSQAKLVQVVVGQVFDVAVDVRRSSPTFGQWVGIILSAQNRRQMWIPSGFAHGYYVLSEWAEITYKTSAFYALQWERTLLWNDPALNIAWPLQEGRAPVVSAKDAAGLPLDRAELFD